MSGILNEMRQSATGALDKAKLVVLNRGTSDVEAAAGTDSSVPTEAEMRQAAEDENSASWSEELSHYCPQLTFQQRLIGFFTSFGLGYLIAFFSFRFFIKLVEGHPMPFCINYTVGMYA